MTDNQYTLETVYRQWEAGGVKRFHTTPIHGENLISAHSWGVTVLILGLNPNCSKELLKAAIYHDIAEHYTGDVPWPAKARWIDLKLALDEVEHELENWLEIKTSLTAEELWWLKGADLLELALFAYQQREMGNRYMNPFIENVHNIFWAYKDHIPKPLADMLNNAAHFKTRDANKWWNHGR